MSNKEPTLPAVPNDDGEPLGFIVRFDCKK